MRPEARKRASAAGPRRGGLAFSSAEVAQRVTKLARAKKRPLDAVCRDRIIGEVTEARGVVAGLGA